MKLFIAFISFACSFAYNITIGAQCTCSQLSTQLDCNTAVYCSWVNGACTNFNCTAASTWLSCATAGNCAWVNNTCQQFTKCSDYSSTSNTSCSTYGLGCSTTGVMNGTTGYNCGQMSLPQCANLNSTNCLTSGGLCAYQNSTCRPLVCGDFNEANCRMVWSADVTQDIICTWNSTACIEAPTLTLNSTTCYQQSMAMYAWSATSNKCVACSSMYSGLLGIIALMLF